MTSEEKNLIVETLKGYELGGKVSMSAVDKVLSEMIDDTTEAKIRADEREKIKKIAEKYIKEHYFPHSRTREIVKYFVEGVVEEYERSIKK